MVDQDWCQFRRALPPLDVCFGIHCHVLRVCFARMISVPFMAIALFGMGRAPLSVIPTWIVQILQTGVALKHVAVHHDEKITDQVTSLQKDLKAKPHLTGGEDEEGLGPENAIDAEKQKEQDKSKNGVLSPSASSDIPSPTFSMLKLRLPPPVTLDRR